MAVAEAETTEISCPEWTECRKKNASGSARLAERLHRSRPDISARLRQRAAPHPVLRLFCVAAQDLRARDLKHQSERLEVHYLPSRSTMSADRMQASRRFRISGIDAGPEYTRRERQGLNLLPNSNMGHLRVDLSQPTLQDRYSCRYPKARNASTWRRDRRTARRCVCAVTVQLCQHSMLERHGFSVNM